MEKLNYELEKRDEESLKSRLLAYEEQLESICGNDSTGGEETC